jgi:hypothetical protein
LVVSFQIQPELTLLMPVKFTWVGMYPNNAEALIAWKGVSHTKVDDAHYKYVIVHLHKVLEPELEDS